VGAYAAIPDVERSDGPTRASHQERRLEALLSAVYGRSGFYTRKLDEAGVRPGAALRVPDDVGRLPLTTKAELIADQDANAPWGSVLSEPIDRYTRYNHTSGTTGRPLRWWTRARAGSGRWSAGRPSTAAAHVDARDRVFFAFSFGPFFGFWTAFDAAAQIGAHCVPAAGCRASSGWR
jgi:phenylacetate-CoA ligase